MATKGCTKYLLIFLNVMVFLVGITCLAAGLMLKLDSGIMETEVVALFNKFTYNNMPLGIIGEALVYLMMGFGGLAMIVAVLGMCGAWRAMKGCLIVYIVIIVFVMILQGCLIGLWMVLRGRSGEWLKGQMLSQLKTGYEGPTATDDVSAGYNILFMKGECCGVNDQFKDGTTSDFPTDNWSVVTEKVPATCCQGVQTSTISSYENSATCTNTPTNFYAQGCYDRVADHIEIYSLIVAISCGVLLLVEIMAIIASCILMDKSKNQVEDISSRQNGRPPPYIAIDKFIEAGKRAKARRAQQELTNGRLSDGY